VQLLLSPGHTCTTTQHATTYGLCTPARPCNVQLLMAYAHLHDHATCNYYLWPTHTCTTTQHATTTASLRTPAQPHDMQLLLWPTHTCTTTQRATTTVAYAHLHDHTTCNYLWPMHTCTTMQRATTTSLCTPARLHNMQLLLAYAHLHDHATCN